MHSTSLAFLAALLLAGACGKGGDGDSPGTGPNADEDPQGKPSPAPLPEDAGPKDEAPKPDRRFDTAEAAWNAFSKAVTEGDAGGVWNVLSDTSIDEVLNGSTAQFLRSIPSMPDEQLAPIASAGGTTAAELRAMGELDLAKTVTLAESVTNKADIVGAEYKGAVVVGDITVVTTSSPAGEKKWAFVDQSDGWRMDGPRTAKLNPRRPPPPVPSPR